MSGHTKTTSTLRNVTAIVSDLTSETDVIATLMLVKELHDWVAAAQTTAVGRAMTEGHTHRDIGAALGVSQQAITKRYGCGRKDEEKDSAEARQKAASTPKALAHFTPNGDYVGYSLSIEVEDLAFTTGHATHRDSQEPSPNAAHQEPWVSDPDAPVAEIAAPSVRQRP